MTDDAGKNAEMRFRQSVERLYRLGPRAVFELLAEIGRERSIQTIIDQKAARYAAMPPAVVEALGAGYLPPTPIYSTSEKIT